MKRSETENFSEVPDLLGDDGWEVFGRTTETEMCKKDREISELKDDKILIGLRESVVIGIYETAILDAVEDMIGHRIFRQFYVNGYYLDGYCPDMRLAIEVDEKHHESKEKRNKDVVRQYHVSKALRCFFLRIKVKDVLTKDRINKLKLKNVEKVEENLKLIRNKEIKLW